MTWQPTKEQIENVALIMGIDPYGESDLLDLLEAMRKYGGVTLATNGDNWTCILAEHGSNNRPSKHQIATASTIAEAVIELAEKIVETIKQGV